MSANFSAFLEIPPSNELLGWRLTHEMESLRENGEEEMGYSLSALFVYHSFFGKAFFPMVSDLHCEQ